MPSRRVLRASWSTVSGRPHGAAPTGWRETFCGGESAGGPIKREPPVHRGNPSVCRTASLQPLLQLLRWTAGDPRPPQGQPQGQLTALPVQILVPDHRLASEQPLPGAARPADRRPASRSSPAPARGAPPMAHVPGPDGPAGQTAATAGSPGPQRTAEPGRPPAFPRSPPPDHPMRPSPKRVPGRSHSPGKQVDPPHG